MDKPHTPLSGQTVVITGAGRGIGAAIAIRLAREGMDTILCGRNREPLDEIAGRIAGMGHKAEVVPCDVTDLVSVQDLAQRVEATHGSIDVLVNNAGVGEFRGPLHTMSPESWERILRTNLTGVYYTIRAFAPMMIRAQSGHIINISSIASKNPLPNGAAYAASKWGLNGLTYSVAEELRGHNVRVSVICPGSVHTEFSPHDGKDPSKMLQPEDIANAVALLVAQAPQSFVSEIVLRPTMKP